MVDETKLLDMKDEELLEILRVHAPMNTAWVGAKAALDIKNAKRMVASAMRMEWVTYVIVAVSALQLALLIVPCFRR